MHDEPGTKTLGALLSLKLGEIRLRDLRPQIEQRHLNGDRSIAVLGLTGEGLPVEVELQFAQKWCSQGWATEFACPICGEPSRVLRARDGVFGCARCAPRSSQHHMLKNTRYWRDGGKVTSAVVQEVIDGAEERPGAHFDALALTLVHDSMARAEGVIDIALAALDVTRSQPERSGRCHVSTRPKRSHNAGTSTARTADISAPSPCTPPRSQCVTTREHSTSSLRTPRNTRTHDPDAERGEPESDRLLDAVRETRGFMARRRRSVS